MNCSESIIQNNKGYREASIFDHVTSKYYNCSSFLIKYSPYRNLIGFLFVDASNDGYKIAVFDIYYQKKIFDFEPITLPIDDFKLNEDLVIVDFADVYGTQIAYDVFTGAVVWQTN